MASSRSSAGSLREMQLQKHIHRGTGIGREDRGGLSSTDLVVDILTRVRQVHQLLKHRALFLELDLFSPIIKGARDKDLGRRVFPAKQWLVSNAVAFGGVGRINEGADGSKTVMASCRAPWARGCGVGLDLPSKDEAAHSCWGLGVERKGASRG